MVFIIDSEKVRFMQRNPGLTVVVESEPVGRVDSVVDKDLPSRPVQVGLFDPRWHADLRPDHYSVR